jgi:hypothetical protein
MADQEIVVPKTPARAYDPNRRPSDLLKRQIAHLEWALLPAAQRNPKRLKAGTVRTEAQAAEYIALLTERVQAAYAARQAGPPAAGPLQPVALPRVPKAPRAPRKKVTRKASRKAAAKATGKAPRQAGRKAPGKARASRARAGGRR